MAFWVIGDIHGMYDSLKKLILTIKKDDVTYKKEKAGKIIFIGDYIDYGPSSKEVIDLITELDYETVFLAGNHEDHALHFIHQTEFCKKHKNMWFRGNGGQETVASFNESDEMLQKLFPMKHYYHDSSKDKLFTPDDFMFDDKYINFFNNLVYSHSETLDFYEEYPIKKLAFLHAGFGKYALIKKEDEPDDWIKRREIVEKEMYKPINVKEQLKVRGFHEYHKFMKEKEINEYYSSIWTREEPKQKFADYILVHGHTPTYILKGEYKNLGNYDINSGVPFFLFNKPNVEVKEDYKGYYVENAYVEDLISINIDTGSVLGGYLTAMKITEDTQFTNDFQFVQVHTGGNHRNNKDIRKFSIHF